MGGGGPLQRLDVETGEVEVLATEVEGRPLLSSNYPIVDSSGNVYCSHTTSVTGPGALDGTRKDGFLFRVNLDRSVELVADNIETANGLAFDADESHIYVCRTTGCYVIRYPIHADRSLGPAEEYGPKLGITAAEVQDERPLSAETRGTLGLTDGCGFDQEGNLWVTLPMSNKVVAIAPGSDVQTIIEDLKGDVMRAPTNVSWGGDGMQDL